MDMNFDQRLIEREKFLTPLAKSLTRDPESAKDLVQETMFRALRSKDRFRIASNIEGWLYTIMKNIYLNTFHRKTRFTPPTPLLRDTVLLMQASLEGSRADEERYLMHKELQSAIRSLPNAIRKPLELFIAGYKYHEIADLLNQPMGTVKSRIHFARQALQPKIKNIF